MSDELLKKYDKQLHDALEVTEGKQGLLFILDGQKGPGISIKIERKYLKFIPELFRSIAKDFDKELEATTEDVIK